MNSDIAQLASTITAFLAPLLPSLWEVGKGLATKMGEGAAEEAGKKIAESTFEKGRAIMNRLQPKVESDPVIRNAMEIVSASPDDVQKRKVLQRELSRILMSDIELARVLHKLLENPVHSKPPVIVNQQGEKSSVIIGDKTTLNIS